MQADYLPPSASVEQVSSIYDKVVFFFLKIAKNRIKDVGLLVFEEEGNKRE